MVDFPDAPWLFVIDTKDYAGNFERLLTAWITGVLGECGVGREERAAARAALSPKVQKWYADHVVLCPDEHGCHRPTSIWQGPKGAEKKFGPYSSVAIFLDRKPPVSIIKVMKDRAGTFNQRVVRSKMLPENITITGFRLIQREITVVEHTTEV
mgnify:CR=1 FL=1